MKEIWKDVNGYEGLYQVSNSGRVKSLSHIAKSAVSATGYKKTKERILKPSTRKNNGYRAVSLCNDGISKTYTVHRLVMNEFKENKHNKEDINHIDGNKTNNELCNLEWCTRSENMQHAIATGLSVRGPRPYFTGENNPNSKLTNIEMMEIHDLYKVLYCKDICKLYGVSESTISRIGRDDRYE